MGVITKCTLFPIQEKLTFSCVSVHSNGEIRKILFFLVPLLKSEDRAQAVIKGANYTLKCHYPSL